MVSASLVKVRNSVCLTAVVFVVMESVKVVNAARIRPPVFPIVRSFFVIMVFASPLRIPLIVLRIACPSSVATQHVSRERILTTVPPIADQIAAIAFAKVVKATIPVRLIVVSVGTATALMNVPIYLKLPITVCLIAATRIVKSGSAGMTVAAAVVASVSRASNVILRAFVFRVVSRIALAESVEQTDAGGVVESAILPRFVWPMVHACV